MKNTINNVMKVNGQKVVIENNSRNSTFHMTMEDLRVFQPEKFDIISEYFKVTSILIPENGYSKTSIPVVDITLGKIYPNLALGKNCQDFPKYVSTRIKVMKFLEKGTPIKGNSHLYDFEGNCLDGHVIMYAEDVPTTILKEYLRLEKIRAEEDKKAKHLKKEVK